MADERRRTTLGSATSAAIPLLWALLAERDWTHAKLAHEIHEDSGNVSRLLYGDRKASRTTSLKLRDLGVAIELWDKPLPDGWMLPHVADQTGPLPRMTADQADALDRAAGG